MTVIQDAQKEALKAVEDETTCGKLIEDLQHRLDDEEHIDLSDDPETVKGEGIENH